MASADPGPASPLAAPKPARPWPVVIVEAVVDLAAILVLAALVFYGKVQHPALVGLCIVVIALLAGIRTKDLVDAAKAGTSLSGGGLTSAIVALAGTGTGALLGLLARAGIGCLVLVVAVAGLQGCPKMPPSDCTSPGTTRCSPSGVPETCSPGRRWTALALARPCAAAGATCCWTRSPYGRDLYACALPAACLPSPAADAGADAR
jgi:hypothetical protein